MEVKKERKFGRDFLAGLGLAELGPFGDDDDDIDDILPNPNPNPKPINPQRHSIRPPPDLYFLLGLSPPVLCVSLI